MMNRDSFVQKRDKIHRTFSEAMDPIVQHFVNPRGRRCG